MRHKKKVAAQQKEDAFAVLFTALSMILLAFFILLNSLSTIDGRKRRDAMGSLLGSFGVLPGGLSFSKTSKLIGRESVTGTADESAIFSSFKHEIKETRLAAILSLDGGYWVLKLREDALYGAGQHTLNPSYFPLLDRVAEIAKATRRSLLIRGFADGGPREAANWLVSSRRAAAVARFLIEAGAVEGSQISAVGIGDRGNEPRGVVDPARRRVEVVFK